MRLHGAVAAATLLIAAAALGAEPPVADPASNPDAAEIMRLEAVWNAAHLQGNADVLERLSADGLVVTVPGMKPFTSAEAFGVLRSGRMRFTRYDVSGVIVRIHGASGVVTGRLQRTRLVGERTLQDDWLFTKLYGRQQGRWRVLAYHASDYVP